MSLENSKKSCQIFHHSTSHTNASGTRLNMKFTHSIDKENLSELSSRRMITAKLSKSKKKRSQLLISEPCSWSKRPVLLQEVPETSCSSREFMTRRLKNGTGQNILNFNIRVYYISSKVTLESTLQLTRRFTSISLTTKNTRQFLKTWCTTTCNAVVWFSEVESDMVLLTKLTPEVSTFTQGNTNTISKLTSNQRT